MVRAKRQFEIVRALRKRGARKVREGANHEVWRCGCEAGHQTELPRHTQITTFVTNRIYKQMLGCPDFGKGLAAVSGRTTYDVTTWREEGWWVIDVLVLDLATQARRLDQVEAMARDAVATWLDVSPDSFDVLVSPKFGEELTKRLAALRAERERAEQAQSRATAEARRLAMSLHAEGLRVRDIGHMLGVSYQRAQQLIQESRRSA